MVWVYFDVPEGDYLRYMAGRDQEKVGSPVELVLADGRKYAHGGKVGAVEARFEADTEGIPFRADFPNPDGLLRHGQTATALMARAVKGAVVIPHLAVFEDHGRRYVWVVGKDNVVSQREIVIRDETEDVLVVGRGLEATDQVVLDGARRVRDGEKLEYEYRKPEDVLGDSKHQPE